MTTLDPNTPLDQLGGSSKYLTKKDIPQPHGRLEVMDKMTVEQVEDGNGNTERCTVLHFAGECPPLIVKKNHTSALAGMGFANAGSLAGQQIVIYIDPNVEFRGERIGGIRLRAPVIQKPVTTEQPVNATHSDPAAQNVPDGPAQPTFDDDIPF